MEIACGPEHRYQPTPALLEAAAAAHGPLAGLIVASPANPTGTQLTREALAALAQWCAARGTRLVSDEIYHGVGGAGPLDSTAWEHDRQAIVISSFSKLWGMTGWRVGWMLLPEELRGPVDALAGNLALCPPSLAQHAALAALSPEAEAEAAQQNEQYVRNREQVLAALPGLLLTAPATPTGAFYVYADASALLARSGCADAAALCRRVLNEARVALAPGDDFDAVDGGRWCGCRLRAIPRSSPRRSRTSRRGWGSCREALPAGCGLGAAAGAAAGWGLCGAARGDRSVGGGPRDLGAGAGRSGG